MKKNVLAFILVFVAATVGVFLFFEEGSLVIGEQPKLQFSPADPVEVKDSVISAALVFRFDTVAERIREQLDGKRIKGEGKKGCFGAGFIKTCWKPSWNLLVEAEDPKLMKLDESSFAITLPMRISGKISSGGRAFNGMQIDARTLWLVETSFSVRDNGCPDFMAQVDYRWAKKPRAKYKTKIATFKIDLTDDLNKKLGKEIRNLERKITEAFECERIQTQLTRNAAKPIGTSSGTPLYMVYRPEAFGLSGYQLTDDRMEMALQMNLALAISSDPKLFGDADAEIVGKRIDANEGKVRINLPVEIPYRELEDRLTKSLIKKTGEVDSPSLMPSMKVVDAKVYPAGDRLAIGLKVAVSSLFGIVEKSAWVYMTIIPELSADGKYLTLSSPEMISIAKSSAVDLLELRDEVNSVMRTSRQDIDQSIRHALETQLTKTEGIKGRWSHGRARITDLELTEGSLRFVIHLDGDIQLKLASVSQ